MKIGQRVTIKGGMPCFVGLAGTVIERDASNGRGNPPLWRVRLDRKVEAWAGYFVTSDLWEAQHLSVTRR